MILYGRPAWVQSYPVPAKPSPLVAVDYAKVEAAVIAAVASGAPCIVLDSFTALATEAAQSKEK